MRILKYIAFLLFIVTLSSSVSAQNKIKGKITYKLGDVADTDNYVAAFNESTIYTFKSMEDARTAISFFVRNKGGKLDSKQYSDKEAIKYSGDAVKIVYLNETDTIESVTLEFSVDYSSEIKAIIVYNEAAIGVPVNDFGEVIWYDITDGADVTKGVYSTFVRSISGPTSSLHFEISDNMLQNISPRPKPIPNPIPPKPEEKPGLLIMDKTFVFPFKLQPNHRLVAQPVWYDRVDIADANSDTVFAYGKAVYLDCNEYALTQNRNMDYNMSNDKLYRYMDTVKYCKKAVVNVRRSDSVWNAVCSRIKSASTLPLYNDELLRVFPQKENEKGSLRDKWLAKLSDSVSRDSLRSIYMSYLFADTAETSIELVSQLKDSMHTRIRISETKDTIFVDAYEELTGHDPNTAHPYPQGVIVAVEDYNRIIELDNTNKDGGERKSSFKFLDFAFNEFVPDAKTFHVVMAARMYDRSEELRLKFRLASAELVEKDSVNEEQLYKLESTFRGITAPESRRRVKRIEITGQASPEGSKQSNLSWAAKRADKARTIIRQYIQQGNIFVNEPQVAPWSDVVALLKADNKIEAADYIQNIIDANPNANEQELWGHISKKYSRLDLEEYLAPLRTIYYKYTIMEEGQLPDAKIIEKYRHGLDSISDFSRAEFWVLLNRLESMEERENVARIALEKTRDLENDTAMKYNNGYWAYAAAHLAACNIAKGKYDLNLLSNFLDMEAIPVCEKPDTVYNENDPDEANYIEFRKRDFIRESDGNYRIVVRDRDMPSERDTLRFSASSVEDILSYMDRETDPRLSTGTLIKYPVLGNKRDSVVFIGPSSGYYDISRTITPPDDTITFRKGDYKWIPMAKKDPETRNMIAYLNQPDIAANQLIMAIKNPDPYWLKHMFMLEQIARQDKSHRYDTLVAVSSCLNGNYKGDDAESVKVRDIVTSTSLKNKVILHIAMDDPNIPGGEDLDIAWAHSRELPDTCSDSNYLRAILYNRKNTEFPMDDEYSLSKAIEMLALSFSQDIGKIYIASNDQDLLSPNGEIVDFALTEWEANRSDEILERADSIKKSIDDIAFLNYKKAIDEFNKNVALQNLEDARLAMYISMMLNEDYYDVLSVRMKGLQKRLKKSTEKVKVMFDGLMDIRRSYNDVRNSLEAGEPVNDAVYHQALREVENLKRVSK